MLQEVWVVKMWRRPDLAVLKRQSGIVSLTDPLVDGNLTSLVDDGFNAALIIFDDMTLSVELIE